MLKRVIFAAILCVAGFAAQAQDRVTLGWGRLMSNDQIGDGEDRWRSGSYTVSRVRGADWNGHSLAAFGDILELRGHASVIAPANLTTPAATDRRYAGVLGFGLYSHFGWRGAEMSLGADISLTGPQSGIGGFQSWFHGLLGMVEPSNAVLNAQIGNRITPGINAEIGRSFGDKVKLRPYAEARVGVETLLRVGGDITIGALGRDDLMLRDETTGQRYRAVKGGNEQGLSLTMGGDVARVFDSALLAETGAAAMRDDRYRLRAGLRAARMVRRLVGVAVGGDDEIEDQAPEMVPDQGFIVTDGHQSFTVTIIPVPDTGARPLMLVGDLPPADQDLWVVRTAIDRTHSGAGARTAGGVICFTPDTRLATPEWSAHDP